MADSVFASTNRGGETHNSKARRKAMKRTLCESVGNPAVDRRRFLNAALSACTIGPPLGFLSMQLAASRAGSLTKEQRDIMTPSQVIDELKKGNERFRTGRMAPRDYLSEKLSSSAVQYPAAEIFQDLDYRSLPTTSFHSVHT